MVSNNQTRFALFRLHQQDLNVLSLFWKRSLFDLIDRKIFSKKSANTATKMIKIVAGIKKLIINKQKTKKATEK